LLFFVSLILFLPACSLIPVGTQIFAPPSSESLQARLLDVSYPLLTAAADWCPFDQEPMYGFLLRENKAGKEQERRLLRGRSVVFYVHPHLPAGEAGLLVGDVILQVNTVPVAEESAMDVSRLIGRLTRAKIQPLLLGVVRGGEVRTLVLSARPACHYGMLVLETDLVNGITDGRRIGVTRGALELFSSDDELGWVVAHEIAHNILSHSQNMKLQSMLRAFLAARGEDPVPSGVMPSRPSLESQADYVGAYLMARAGYDLSAIKRVWEQLRRVEARNGNLRTQLAETHPPTHERLAAFQTTLQEIETKRQAGQPLDFLLEDAR